MLLLWISGVLRRRFLRLAGAVVGVAVSVALVAAIVLFLVNANRSMTERAVATAPIDWQVQLVPGADPDVVGRAVSQAVRVADIHRAHYVDVAGFEAQTEAPPRQPVRPGYCF